MQIACEIAILICNSPIFRLTISHIGLLLWLSTAWSRETGRTEMIDRSEVNRALAKSIAFKQCGKDLEANMWAVKLITLLNAHAFVRADFIDA